MSDIKWTRSVSGDGTVFWTAPGWTITRILDRGSYRLAPHTGERGWRYTRLKDAKAAVASGAAANRVAMAAANRVALTGGAS